MDTKTKSQKEFFMETRQRFFRSRAAVLCLMVSLTGAVFGQVVTEGGWYLLRKSTTMPDGRVKVGSLAVEPGKDGGEAQVKAFIVEGGDFKEKLITMSALAKWASPVKGFCFGVSVDDELVLIDRDTVKGPEVDVLQNAKGKHSVPHQDIKAWLKGDVSIIKATRSGDGRIRIGETPVKQSADSVLAGKDGADLALVQVSKQKAAEPKGVANCKWSTENPLVYILTAVSMVLFVALCLCIAALRRNKSK